MRTVTIDVEQGDIIEMTGVDLGISIESNEQSYTICATGTQEDSST